MGRLGSPSLGSNPDRWEDPASRTPNSGLQNSYSVDSGVTVIKGVLLFGSAQGSGNGL